MTFKYCDFVFLCHPGCHISVVRHQNRPFTEIVQEPSLALSTFLLGGKFSAHGRGQNQMIFRGPSNSGHSMILCSSRTICNGYKWKEIWFSLDIRKKLFSMRMVRYWNRLPEKLWVSQEVLKDRELKNVVQMKVFLGWNEIILMAFSNKIHSIIL